MAGTWISPKDLTSDKDYKINGVTIKECLLVGHNPNGIELPCKRTKPFKGVVIHNTNGANSSDDGRQYTVATINGNMASRTHYYVTNLGAWKNLADTDMNWTCGDGVTGEGNNGCISLEIIMDSKTSAKDLKARDNGAKIAAYILYQNGMTVNDMYTHNYFLNIRNGVKGDYNKLCISPTPTRNCPYYIVWDWENFRKQVDKYIAALGGKSVYSGDKLETAPISKVNKKYIYKAISRAAIRSGASKEAPILERVVRDKYYPAEKINDSWIRHLNTNNYSMLTDYVPLFEEEGECEVKITTVMTDFRISPTEKSNKIYILKPNVRVYVFKTGTVRNEGHTWYRAVIKNTLGYVVGDNLKDV